MSEATAEDDRTVQNTAPQVRSYTFPYPALESLDWPSLPTTAPATLQEARDQALELDSLIQRATALQLPPREVQKLTEYQGHLVHSISSYLNTGKTFALGSSLGILTAYRLSNG